MRTTLAYATMCLIWGTTWLAIKIGLHTLGPLTGVGLRFLVAGLLLGVVAVSQRKVLPWRDYPWSVIAVFAATLFGLDYIFTYISETHLDSGLVSVLFGIVPFFSFAFGWLMIGERSSPIVWLGAALALSGVAVASLSGEVRGAAPYVLCIVAAACVAAFGNVYAKRHAQYDPLVTLPPSMLLGGIAVTALGLIFERTAWHDVLSPASLGALLYLAIFGSCIAFFLMLWLLKRVPAYAIGLATLIFPMIALAVGAVFGGEHVGSRELIGTALVIGGLTFTLRQPATQPSASESS